MAAAIILALPLAAVGLLDDMRHVSTPVRLALQVAIVSIFLILIGDLPNLLNFPFFPASGVERDVWSSLEFLVLLFAGVWWINLFNFMDGIDGIAGLQTIFMLSVGAGMAAWGHPDVYAEPLWVLMLSVSAATAGFLFFNWPPASIFMGDVGSTWVAFIIFVTALLTVAEGWLSYAVWLVLAAVFIVDSTLTLIDRLARGEHWYEGHRSHVYQRLSRHWHNDRKRGHRKVSLLVGAVNLIWLMPLAWLCLLYPHWASRIVLVAYLPLVVFVWLVLKGKFSHV